MPQPGHCHEVGVDLAQPGLSTWVLLAGVASTFCPRGRRASFLVSVGTWVPPLPDRPRDLGTLPAPTVRGGPWLCVPLPAFSTQVPRTEPSLSDSPRTPILQSVLGFVPVARCAGALPTPSVLPWTCHVTRPEGTCALGVPCPLGQCRGGGGSVPLPTLGGPELRAGMGGPVLGLPLPQGRLPPGPQQNGLSSLSSQNDCGGAILGSRLNKRQFD